MHVLMKFENRKTNINEEKGTDESIICKNGKPIIELTCSKAGNVVMGDNFTKQCCQ